MSIIAANTLAVLAGWAVAIIVGSTAGGIILIAIIVNIIRNASSRKTLSYSNNNAVNYRESITKSLNDNPLLHKKGDNYYYGDYLVASIFLEINKCILKTYSYYKYGTKIKRACVYIRITDDGTLEQGRYLCVVAYQSVGIL